MVASDAPVQIIRMIMSQNRGSWSSSPLPMLFPSSTSRSMGQWRKFHVLYSGTSAQRTVSTFQCSMPKRAKKRVEPRTTPTAPQQ